MKIEVMNTTIVSIMVERHVTTYFIYRGMSKAMAASGVCATRMIIEMAMRAV